MRQHMKNENLAMSKAGDEENEEPLRALRSASRCLASLKSDVSRREVVLEEAVQGLGNSALVGAEVQT